MLEIVIIMPLGDGKLPRTKRNTHTHTGKIICLLSKRASEESVPGKVNSSSSSELHLGPYCSLRLSFSQEALD